DRRIDQDLQKVRRAAIADRVVSLDQFELRVEIAGTRWNDRATERARGSVENEAAGRDVIAESVQHDVARSKAGRKQRARAPPGIGVPCFRLEDRSWRGV